MTRYLTKSRFKLAVECPTKLYYSGKDKEYRNLKQEDSFLQALADGGFQVGKMATMLYPRAIEIKSRSNAAAEAKTARLLAEHDQIVLFEPAIRFRNLFIRIDILVKQGDHFELIEVKAKSYDSINPQIAGTQVPIKIDMLPYIQDVAFQKYVLQSAFPDAAISSFLMMPDKAKVAAIDGLNQLFKVRRDSRSAEVIVMPGAQAAVDQSKDLLAKVPVDSFVDIVMQQGIEFPGGHLPLPEAAEVWAKAYEQDARIPPTLHKDCAKCEFREHAGSSLKSGFHQCVGEVMHITSAEIDQGTVLDIWYYMKKNRLLAQGIYRYHEVQESDINPRDDRDGLSRSQRQWMQVSGLPKEDQAQGFYIDRNLIRRQMQSWRYRFLQICGLISRLPFNIRTM
jgi:hypothetical protein